MILVLLLLLAAASCLSSGGRCHIKLASRIFYLKPLETYPYYEYKKDDGTTYLFNFCDAVDAPDPYPCPPAYAMALFNDSTCESYASNSLLYLYETQLYNQSGRLGVTILEQSGVPIADGSVLNRTTNLTVVCDYNGEGFKVQDIFLDRGSGQLTIIGSSKHGCPALEISSLWQALSNNAAIFGMVLLVAGVTELFCGRKMLQPTIFIAAYCLSFAILGAILSEFVLRSDSSLILIYFSLLIALFLSSCIAYMIMGVTHISMFVVGACNALYYAGMGLIVAALLNSIFIKIFKIYSVWSLVGFALVFCILLGLLGYRFYDHIVILSTSLTGAYMIIRPISWIFGGFPNEFILAQQIKAGSLPTLPSIFFIYFALILVLMILGATYQFLQFRREQSLVSDTAIEIGMVQGKIEAGIDSVRNSVNALVNRYRINDENEGEDNQAGKYIEFQEYRKLDSEKPLYPHLESKMLGNNRQSDQSSLKENISISGSFIREISEKQKEYGEEAPPKVGYSPPIQQVKRISIDSDDSRPSRDSNTLNRKLEEIRRSGSRFSKERLASEEEKRPEQKKPIAEEHRSPSHSSNRESDPSQPPKVGPFQ